jgi:hypothetical protein
MFPELAIYPGDRAQTLLSLELLLRLVMVCMLGSSTVLLLGLGAQ